MKIKTNAGEVELTAEMVCRGMVFTAADYHLGGGLFVVGRRDDANNVWRDAGDDGLGTNLLGAQRFLGCDPTVASRADCERFGVHGDAAAHGFARLRDGGAVDFEPDGGTPMPVGARVHDDADGQRIVLPRTPYAARFLAERERFIGLDARHASPEDVRRLCCGAEHLSNEQYDPHLCTLAIGDHDEHEDLATGVKWSAGAGRYLSDAKPREDFNANLRAAATGATVTSGFGNGFLFDGSAKGLSGAAKGSGGHRVNGASMVVGTPIYVTSDGRGTLNAAEAAPGCSVPVGTVVSGNMLRIDDGGTYVRGNENYRVGVDPARPGTEATAFVSAAMRKAGESLAAVGEAAKRCAESAMPVPSRCPCDALGRGAPGLHTKDCKAARREKEAALVALVAAVPERLDPIGWRAAVLGTMEQLRKIDDDGAEIRWRLTDERPGKTGSVERLIREEVYSLPLRLYQRAITPAAPVDRVRATWKTRGPVLPCDNGWDE